MKSLRYIYISSFLFTLFVALTSYVHSSFLTEVHALSDFALSLVYSLGAVLSASIVLLIPHILHRINIRNILLTLLVVNILGAVGMIIHTLPTLVSFAFILLSGVSAGIYLIFDTAIEHNSTDKETGKIRGVYYTLLNTAWVIAPLIAGFIIRKIGYDDAYSIGIILLAFSLILIYKTFHTTISVSSHNNINLINSLRSFVKKVPLRHIGISSFLLQFYYAVMVIYSPLYLHEGMGISWTYLSIIFTIMLLPFPLSQSWLGRIADTKYGERELLGIGYGIIIISTPAFAVLQTSTWWMWAIVLFFTRIGAAIVEIMNESYFFKHTDDKHPNHISVYRLAYPLAYITAPLIFSLFYKFSSPYILMFLILALIMLLGIVVEVRIKDTQ